MPKDSFLATISLAIVPFWERTSIFHPPSSNQENLLSTYIPILWVKYSPT